MQRADAYRFQGTDVHTELMVYPAEEKDTLESVLVVNGAFQPYTATIRLGEVCHVKLSRSCPDHGCEAFHRCPGADAEFEVDTGDDIEAYEAFFAAIEDILYDVWLGTAKMQENN